LFVVCNSVHCFHPYSLPMVRAYRALPCFCAACLAVFGASVRLIPTAGLRARLQRVAVPSSSSWEQQSLQKASVFNKIGRTLSRVALMSEAAVAPDQVAMKLPSWQQSMLRIKDPTKSLAFYQELMGMRLLDRIDFESMGFSLYFLASIPENEETPEPGTAEAHSYLWNYPGTTLELTHNYGTENEEGAVYHAGNLPQVGNRRDGFGHIAFSVGDVYEFSENLEERGIKFQKKPNEGRMKGLAFALDPDGYWVELLGSGLSTPPCLAQTMLRVKDPAKSIEFYTKHFGMEVLSKADYADFSLFFLGSSNYKQGCPVLELTHNHGTEKDPEFSHFTGNEDGRKGFGHIGFLVDDVYKTCADLSSAGYELQKAPDAGSMKGLAFVKDPDGYWVEVIKRGGYDAQATPYFFEGGKA